MLKTRFRKRLAALTIGLALAFSIFFGNNNASVNQVASSGHQITIVADGGGRPPGGG